MSALREEWLVGEARANAVVAWLLVGVLVVLVGVYQLLDDPVGAAFTAVVAGVVLVPAVEARSWLRMPPWPLVLLAVLPAVFGPFGSGLFFDAVGAVGVATLALLVVVDLQLLTTVRMSTGFAVGFVVVAAMGVAGFWAVGRYLGSVYLGSPFVETNDELMYEFLTVTVSGIVAALVLRWYLRRRRHRAEGGGGAAAPTAGVTDR